MNNRNLHKSMILFIILFFLGVKETGQQKQELFPIGSNKYTFSVLEMDVVFEEIENGKAQVLKLVGKKEIVAKRVE